MVCLLLGGSCDTTTDEGVGEVRGRFKNEYVREVFHDHHHEMFELYKFFTIS